MKLTERVTILTDTGTKLAGYLFVGADGLPALKVKEDAVEGEVWQAFTPAQFPAAWTVCWRNGNATNVLFDKWAQINYMLKEIRDAQRDAEAETLEPEPEDSITAYKRDADARGER